MSSDAPLAAIRLAPTCPVPWAQVTGVPAASATAAGTMSAAHFVAVATDLPASVAANTAALSSHAANTSNPHATTAAQVGAYSTSAADTLLAAKAPLASPALTGTPAAPTAAAATNTTQIATCAFVRGEVAALVNAAPGTLDTLGEIAAQLASDESTAAALATAVGGKLAKASNLSDLANVATARTSLGLGTMAVQPATAVAITGGTIAGLTSLDVGGDANLVGAVYSSGLVSTGSVFTPTLTSASGSTLSIISGIGDGISVNSGSGNVAFNGNNLTGIAAATLSGELTVGLVSSAASATAAGSIALALSTVNDFAASGKWLAKFKNLSTTAWGIVHNGSNWCTAFNGNGDLYTSSTQADNAGVFKVHSASATFSGGISVLGTATLPTIASAATVGTTGGQTVSPVFTVQQSTGSSQPIFRILASGGGANLTIGQFGEATFGNYVQASRFVVNVTAFAGGFGGVPLGSSIGNTYTTNSTGTYSLGITLTNSFNVTSGTQAAANHAFEFVSNRTYGTNGANGIRGDNTFLWLGVNGTSWYRMNAGHAPTTGAFNASSGTELAMVVTPSFAGQTGTAGWTALKVDATDGAGGGTKLLADLRAGGTQKASVDAGGNARFAGSLGVGNSAAATTPGTVVKKIEVFDASGASLGYVPVYDAIT